MTEPILRICHLSDSHFSDRRRLHDTVKTHERIVTDALDADVDLFVHTGDLYDAASTPTERQAAADFVQVAAQVAPVVIVKGNHDQPKDLAILRRLESDHEISVLERATVANPLRVVGVPVPVSVLALPWIDRHLVDGVAANVARDLLAAAAHQARHLKADGIVPLFAAHLMVVGSRVSTGQTMYGTGLEFAPADIQDVPAVYRALGHVHKAQQFDAWTHYAGSPTALNFGEPETKTWNLVTVTGDLAHVEQVPTGAPGLLLLDGDWDGAAMNWDCSTARDAAGCHVRVRVKVAAQHLDTLPRDNILASMDGALSVKIEPVILAERRTRTDLKLSTMTDWEKLVAYLEHRAIAYDHERLRRLLASLEETGTP